MRILFGTSEEDRSLGNICWF